MFRMNRSLTLAAAMVAMVAVVGCSSGAKKEAAPQGMAKISAALKGTSNTAIDRVVLTITGGSTITQNLVATDATHWSAFVTNIPAGTYTFTIDAFAGATPTPPLPANAKLYTGSATAIVLANQTIQVAILAQEVSPAVPPDTHVPRIDSLTASAVSIVPSTATVPSNVTVGVGATDLDGNPMTYHWADNCGGTFTDAAAASTVWKAPLADATCQLSILISDAVNQTSVTAYIVVQVQTSTAGGAQVNATFNSFPVVAIVKLDEFVVQTGQAAAAGKPVGVSADIAVTATDPDGDPLTYTYTSSCNTAVFDFPPATAASVGPVAGSANAHFFFADPAGNCAVSVAVSDGRGGTTTGVVYMAGGKPVVSAPVILRAVAPNSTGVVTAGTKYSLRVEARDPNGTGLSFAWSNVSGTLSNQQFGPGNTQDSWTTVDWTAPSPLVSPMSVTLTATNLGAVPHLNTVYTFTFLSNDPCSGKADGFACQGTNLCIQGMTCLNQVCQGGTTKPAPTVGACQSVGLCDPTTGNYALTAKVDTTPCTNSANLCQKSMTCLTGVCQGGAPLACTSANACLTVGACAPSTGVCPAAVPVAAGTVCTTPTSPNLCVNSFVCDGTAAGNCNGNAADPKPAPAPGVCQTVSATCVPATGWVVGSASNGTSCAQHAPCQTSETCTGGVCGNGTPFCTAAGSSCSVVGGVAACFDAAPVPQLAKSLDLTNFAGVAVDLQGFSYATGGLNGTTASFDGTTVASKGANDVFLGKYDPATRLPSWVKGYGDGSDQQAKSVAVTGDNVVVSIGSFLGTMGSCSSATVCAAPSASNNAAYPIDFVMGVDSATGNVKWVNGYDNGTGGALQAVAANPALNQVIVCGKASAQPTALVGTNSRPITGGATDRDIVIASLNSQTGAVLWAFQYGATNAEECSAITVDSVGNVYAAGQFTGPGSFPIVGTTNLAPAPASAFQKYIWVAKFNGTNGAPISQGAFGSGAGNHYPNAIAVGASATGDKIVLAGKMSSSLPFGGTASLLTSPGGDDGFVAKVDPANNYVGIWAARVGSTTADEIRGMALDSVGNVFVAGIFSGVTTTTGGGVAALTLTGTGASAFLLKLHGTDGVLAANSTGPIQYVFGSTTGTAVSGNKIAINSQGTGTVKDLVFTGGEYQGPVNFVSNSLNNANVRGWLLFSTMQ